MARSKEVIGSALPYPDRGVLTDRNLSLEPIKSGPDVTTSVRPAPMDTSHSGEKVAVLEPPSRPNHSGRPEGRLSSMASIGRGSTTEPAPRHTRRPPLPRNIRLVVND